VLEVRLARSVGEALRRTGDEALTVELALVCGDLVRKDAVAYAGSADPDWGFQSVRIRDVDVFWRQRVVVDVPVPGHISARVTPRRLDVRTLGNAFVANASYA